MRSRASISALSVILLCTAARASESGPRPAPHQHQVTIEAVQFQPAELTVHRGDRIVWTNKDPFPHTVTAESKAFDSHNIAPGASWTYVTRRVGEFPYACTLHPTMKGKLIVQ